MSKSDWWALIVCSLLLAVTAVGLLWGWFADAKGL